MQHCSVDMGAAAEHHATMHRGTVQPRGDGRRRAKASTVLAAAPAAASRVLVAAPAAAKEQEFDCENLYHMVQLSFNEQCDHVTCLTQQLLRWPLWSLWPFIIHAVSDYKKL